MSSFQIANSNLVKNQIIQHYRFPANRIAVIANGIDFAFFNPEWCARKKRKLREKMGFSDQDLVILCVANNFRRKGVATIVKALDLAQRPDRLKLLVAGRGKPFTAHPGVRFLGHQPDIRPCYAMADCLVLPTLYDPCANVILEAMACAVVPVTPATNGASEFIQHGRNGFIMASWKDARDLARILGELQARPAKRRELARQARDSVRHLTLARNARKVLAVCRQAVSPLKDGAGTRGNNSAEPSKALISNPQSKDTD